MHAAGRYCIGFSTAENHQFNSPYYLSAAVEPIMEMCVTAGCRFFFNEKGTFWSSVLGGNRTVGDVLFNPRLFNVSTPSAEDSNSHTPDLNLGARVGAFVGHAVSAWKARIVADTFCVQSAVGLVEGDGRASALESGPGADRTGHAVHRPGLQPAI